MPERPPIQGNGTIRSVYEPGRLYQVEMPNGHLAYAVVPRGGPRTPEKYFQDAAGAIVVVEFKPYDMSRCKIVRWPDGGEYSTN